MSDAPQEEGGPIPEELHSFYEDRAFVSCTRCGESLADFEEGYRISKNFKKGEVLIEYALCTPCLLRMLEESSEESKQNLAKFHQERQRDVSGFGECSFCERTRAEARNEEFGIAGVCQGDRLLDSAMICVDCMEDMHADFEPFPGERITKTAV